MSCAFASSRLRAPCAALPRRTSTAEHVFKATDWTLNDFEPLKSRRARGNQRIRAMCSSSCLSPAPDRGDSYPSYRTAAIGRCRCFWDTCPCPVTALALKSCPSRADKATRHKECKICLQGARRALGRSCCRDASLLKKEAVQGLTPLLVASSRSHTQGAKKQCPLQLSIC